MKFKNVFLIAISCAFLVFLSGCGNTNTKSTLYDEEKDKNIRIILPSDYEDRNIVKSAFDLKADEFGEIYYKYYIGKVEEKKGNEYLVFPDTSPDSDTTSNLNLGKKIKISKFDTSFIIKNDKNIHIGDRLLIRKAAGVTKDEERKNFFNNLAYYYSFTKIGENE